MADLSKYDAAFDGAVPAETNSEPPDGKYHVHVHRVEIKTSKNGEDFLSWQFVIDEGAQKGRYLFKRSYMATPQNMSFLKKDLATVGLAGIKLSDLPEKLASLLDIKMMITRKTKGDFVNIYMDKRIPSENVVPTDAVPKSDIPF
jgi:hypothetical protein